MTKDLESSENKTKDCPDGRLSSPVQSVDGRSVVDLNTYIPSFLSTINNSLSRGASVVYRKEFGIGIVDWRVISMLAVEPSIHAVRICDVISTDKGQVSRALVRLHEMQLVDCEVVGVDVRKKRWWLTEAGFEMHDKILAIALERERMLIAGCSPEDIEAFLRVARKMNANVKKF